MKIILRSFGLLLGLILSFTVSAQLLITEVMYNPPESGNDSLEYIEIYNAGADLDVTGYRMEGVQYDFPAGIMTSGEFKIIAINPDAFENVFGMTAESFGGALSNGGEDVSIRDENDAVVHEIIYDNSDPWPTSTDGAAGEGASIVLCDFDNPSLPESWKASQNLIGVTINGKSVKGSPNATEDPGCEGGPSGIVVTTDGLDFVPKDITINVGETITFYNGGGGNHNVNGSLDAYPDNPEGFYSGDPSSDAWEYPFTFNIAGVYDYQCDLHVGAGMVGTVTVLAQPDNSDLRVTEVFYNSGIQLDTLEFIELFNAGTGAAQLENYTLQSAAINSTLGAMTVAPGEYAVICKNKTAFEEAFGTGINAIEWGEGTLSNGGDNIIMLNADGAEIINVSYEDVDPWPLEADGFGASLILCNPFGSFSIDNIQANTFPEITFADKTFQTSPGMENYCTYSIDEVSQVDGQGVNTKTNYNAIIEGVVYGINLRQGGLQFTVIDDAGDGIGVFSNDTDFGYAVTEGDIVQLRGNIGQFNGLSQIYLDDVQLLNTTSIAAPTVVTELNESTESQLITIENVSIVNPDDWDNFIGGFNVEVTNGTNTFNLRIDNDLTDIIPLAYPTGTFNLTGIGGQFDQNAPYDEGYQILPRYMSDIDPFNPFVNNYPPRTIGEMTENDAEGVADSLDINCTLEGTVYGFNLRATGLQFTIIDDAGDGIAIFSSAENFGYTPNEGDYIQVKGQIDQFNGLTELIPDSLFVLGTEDLINPIFIISDLGEYSESQYVKISNTVELVDPTQWLGDGSTFSVDVTDGSTTWEILIDNETDLANTPLPAHDLLEISGIGSQRDISAPFDEGYRIVPRYADDINFIVSTENYLDDNSLMVYPNPASNFVVLEGSSVDVISYEMYDILGGLTSKGTGTLIDITAFNSGNYLIKVFTSKGVVTKKVDIIR